jgi:hypothetical protein
MVPAYKGRPSPEATPAPTLAACAENCSIDISRPNSRPLTIKPKSGERAAWAVAETAILNSANPVAAITGKHGDTPRRPNRSPNQPLSAPKMATMTVKTALTKPA